MREIRPGRRTILVLLGILGLVGVQGCSDQASAISSVDGGDGGQAPPALQIFAAASLTDVFAELGDRFVARNPGVEVAFNFAGSQQLAQQIVNGAPADVFASADERQMGNVVASGLIRESGVQPFAYSRLVVAYPVDNPASIKSLADLATPGLKIVMAAEEVPAGRYSMKVLENASRAGLGEDFRERVLENVVSYENSVRSVLSKIALGEADVGLVYLTDVLGDQSDKVGYLPIPTELSVQAVYPIAVLVNSQNQILSEAFIAFLLSSEGQEIFTAYGFGSPGQGGSGEVTGP